VQWHKQKVSVDNRKTNTKLTKKKSEDEGKY